jgi:hypothetical protein
MTSTGVSGIGVPGATGGPPAGSFGHSMHVAAASKPALVHAEAENAGRTRLDRSLRARVR